MRARSLLAAVVVVVGLSVPASRALARRPGEITSDVTVREWPADDAPAVGELGAGASVVAYGHRHGWLRVTGAARGWIPNEAFAATPDDNDQRKALLAQLSDCFSEQQWHFCRCQLPSMNTNHILRMESELRTQSVSALLFAR